MASLIEEIQRGAIDKNTPIDTLLRQAKLAAAKLNLDGLESWVSQELEGYTTDVPEYRKLVGAPKAWNPYRGWIPIYMSKPSHMKAISTAQTGQAIGTIVDMLADPDSQFFHFPLPPDLVAVLNNGAEMKSPQMAIEVSRSHLVSIVDRVRDLLLDWAIKMEKAGIVGHGLSFSDKEKQIAQESRVTNINIASIGTLTGSIGSNNTIGNIAAGDINIAQSRQLLSDVVKYTDDLLMQGADAGKLKQATDSLAAEHSKPQPDPSAVKSGWDLAREAINAGTGGLVSAAVKAAIGGLIGGGGS